MPIYEYRCEACERRFEVLTSFSERDRAHTCPSCESTRTRVQVSTFAAIGGDSGFTSTLPMAPTPRTGGGGCCGGACGCSHN